MMLLSQAGQSKYQFKDGTAIHDREQIANEPRKPPVEITQQDVGSQFAL